MALVCFKNSVRTPKIPWRRPLLFSRFSGYQFVTRFMISFESAKDTTCRVVPGFTSANISLMISSAALYPIRYISVAFDKISFPLDMIVWLKPVRKSYCLTVSDKRING